MVSKACRQCHPLIELPRQDRSVNARAGVFIQAPTNAVVAIIFTSMIIPGTLYFVTTGPANHKLHRGGTGVAALAGQWRGWKTGAPSAQIMRNGETQLPTCLAAHIAASS